MSEPKKFVPVYLNSRRESAFVLCTWLVFCVWVVGVCLKNGYDINPDNLQVTMGMPSWVFWGIGLPWLMANVVTIWFALKFVADDPLEDPPSQTAAEAGNDSTPEAGNE